MKEPRSIFLLSSSPRSGSTWLTKALSRIENTTVKAELFNPKIDSNIHLLNMDPTCKNYFKYALDSIQEAKKNNQNFLFSTFFEHCKKIELLIGLILISDVVIFNYRTDILRQWISYKKSAMAKIWQNKNLTYFKIPWIEEEFLTFRKNCEITFNIICLFKKDGMYFIKFGYEEIHKFKTDAEKISLVNSKLNSFDLHINDLSDIDLKKQNKPLDYKDMFSNSEEFLQFKDTHLFNVNYECIN